MSKFGIANLVSQIGDVVVISGVSSTFSNWGDPTESFTPYVVLGIVQVMDGTEDEVVEGLLDKEDIEIFVDDSQANSNKLVPNNCVTLSGAHVVSGIYVVVNSIHNDGHYDIFTKRVMRM
jgi:hypothetical protein